jgi:hypothetical protein
MGPSRRRTDGPRDRRGGRRRVERPEQLGVVAEPTGREDHCAGPDLVVTDCRAHDRPVLDEQPVDALAERDVDTALAARAMEGVDDALAALDRPGAARHALVAAEDQLRMELNADVDQPVERRAPLVREPPHHLGVEAPLVQRHVVVEERLAVVDDAGLMLQPRAGRHDDAARQARRPSDDPFGLGDHDSSGAGLEGRVRCGEPGNARADDDDVDRGHDAPPWSVGAAIQRPGGR